MAAYPVTGTPTPSGSANPNPAYTGIFVPEIWSKKLGERLTENTILSRITTGGWVDAVEDGGGTIVVRYPPSITIQTYQANQVLGFQRPSAPVTRIDINQGWYFNAAIDDVHLVQSDLEMLDVFATGAAQDMKVTLEAFFLPVMGTDIATQNKGATAGLFSGNVNLGTSGLPVSIESTVSGTGETPISMLSKLAQVLDEQGVPATDRWALVPPWFAAALESTLDVIGSQKGVTAEDGSVGRICRFDVYSNQHMAVNAATQPILAGHKRAVAFASQLSSLETIRLETSFQTALRGLQVAGLKTMNNKMIALAFVAPGAGYNGATAVSSNLGADLLPATPSDSTILPANYGYRVNAAGDVVFLGAGSTTPRTLLALPIGTIIPVAVSKIMIGTTATVGVFIA